MLSIVKKSQKGLPAIGCRLRRLQAGFTLIEMLVVIAIISILIGIGVNTFTIAQKKARDVKKKADISTIKKALIAYGLDNNGNYQCSGANCTTLTTLLEPNYLTKVPTSPVASQPYNFMGTGTTFQVNVLLENTADPDAAPQRTNPALCPTPATGTAVYCQTNDQ